MSTKQNQNDTDPRILIAQMNQAWSDARSYTGYIWQIAALCLTVIALSLNVAYASASIEPLLILLLLFTSLLASGGVFAIQWLRYNITYRVAYIQEIEEKLVEVQDEYKTTPSSHLFGFEKGPLAFLFALLVLTAGALFLFLAYVSHSIFISMSLEISVSTVLALMIFSCLFLPYCWYVIRKETDLRRKERESARNWKPKFRERLWKVIEELRSEGHTLKVVYSFPSFGRERERESDVDFVIESDTYQFTFITRTSYWASKKKWDDARVFENQIAFIVTPHHERFPKQRNGILAISSAVSSKELRKYLLDGEAGKLRRIENDITGVD
jgi:hypothetical protein